VAETQAIEDENTAANQEAASTTDAAVNAFNETVASTVAQSADAATTEALDSVRPETVSPAATTSNAFAAQPAAGAQTGTQPRRVPVPADPYHIAPGDVLFVSVIASGTGASVIDKDFAVEPSGSVALGPQHGRVKIGGLSLEDAEKAIAAHLEEKLREPLVQITIGGWRNPEPRLDNSNQPPGLRFPWESDAQPNVSTTSQIKSSLGTANPNELAALQEHVKFLEEHFRRKDALFRVAARGGSADARDIAAYELATARGQLALAEGQRDEAIRLFEEAQKVAEQAMISVTAANQANMTTDNVVLQAARNLSESKRRLIELQQATAPTAGTSAAESAERRNAIPQISITTPAPAVSESIGVLKKIVQRAEQEYKRAQELAQNNAVSSSEVARAQSEYEISVERLKQGERALRFYRAQVEMAEAEYQMLRDAIKRAPGAVPSIELRRKMLELEMAKAKLEELAE
jgi:hypothetical protein